MPDAETLILTIGGATLAIGLAGGGASIGQRMAASASGTLVAEKPEKFGLTLILTVLVETSAIYGLLTAILILARMEAATNFHIGLAALSAGICVGVSGFFTGIGEGIAASASIGAISEREAVFGKCLVLTVLPETGAIYGLLTAVLILRGAGFLGVPSAEPAQIGIASLYASLAVCLTSITSYLQGRVGSSSISAIARREEAFGREIIFVVLLESVSIYGLLVGILILRYTGIL
jgi:V/A-type H+-transporting ATPase subunit K